MHSTHNEVKSVAADRFIRTLKNKIYKCMTLISKHVYIDKLDDIVNKGNSTYCRTIKIKSVDVKSSICTDSSKDINDKDSKFKIGDIVRISKHKNIFAKGHFPNWSEEVFITNVKYAKDEEIVETFYKKELQNTNQNGFTVENVIKWKSDKLCVK